MNTVSSQFEIIINTRQQAKKYYRKSKLASISFKEEKFMKKKLAMVLTGVAVCGLLMVACQGKDKEAATDGVQTEDMDSSAEPTPEVTEPEAEPTPEATEPEADPEAAGSGDETAPEAGEAENSGENEGEDTDNADDAEQEAGAEGEDGSADANAAAGEEPETEGDTETKAE